MKFKTAVKQAIEHGYTHLKAADGQLTELKSIGNVTPKGHPVNGWIFYHHSYTEPRIATNNGYYELEPKPEPCKHAVDKQEIQYGKTYCNECGAVIN